MCESASDWVGHQVTSLPWKITLTVEHQHVMDSRDAKNKSNELITVVEADYGHGYFVHQNKPLVYEVYELSPK
jgi:hypothetical protein